MLFFLYGPDTYRSRQKLNEIIEHYKELHKKGLNFVIFDCAASDFQDFKNETGTVSMFGDKKLIVVKNAFGSAQFKEGFIKNSEKFASSKDIIVFYEDGKIAANDSLLKLLKKEAKCQEFANLSGQKLKLWIKQEFEKYRAGVSAAVLEKFFISCNGDLWRLNNDIKKLVAFKFNDKTEITAADFDKLVKFETENDIFKTIESAAAKNRKQAIFLIHKHLNNGETPLYLLTMLCYQFRNVLIIKDLVDKGTQYQLIAKKTNLHPFAVRKTYDLCRKFTIFEIKKIYQRIFQADFDIKTGKAEPETVLDLLISRI